MAGDEAFQAAPIKPTIAHEILEQIDIRVGTIEAVEDVPKSDKLVKLIVDFGDHKRQILAGMAIQPIGKTGDRGLGA